MATMNKNYDVYVVMSINTLDNDHEDLTLTGEFKCFKDRDSASLFIHHKMEEYGVEHEFIATRNIEWGYSDHETVVYYEIGNETTGDNKDVDWFVMIGKNYN